MRRIQVADGDISATAEGTNEIIDRIPTLTRIHVHYTLRIPSGAPQDKVSRALETHVSKCPTAQSLKGAVDITWDVDLEAT